MQREYAKCPALLLGLLDEFIKILQVDLLFFLKKFRTWEQLGICPTFASHIERLFHLTELPFYALVCPEFLLPYFDDTFIASDVKRLSHDGLSSEQLREVWEALAIPERIADASGVDSREALIQFASIVAPEFLRRQNMNLDDITTSVADSLFPGLRSICPLADETLQRVRLAFLCNEDPIAEISSTVNGIDSIHLVASNAFGLIPTSWTTRGFEGMMHLMRFPNIDNACKQSIYDIVAGRLVITVHSIIGLTPIQAVLAITDPEPLCEFESKSYSVTALYMAWICRHPPVRLCSILREDGVDVASFVDRLFTSPEASLDSWVEEITETGLLEMIPRATEDCKQVLMQYIISVLVGRRTQEGLLDRVPKRRTFCIAHATVLHAVSDRRRLFLCPNLFVKQLSKQEVMDLAGA